ncbi:hypothetical protein [Halovivax limisalsi]|uniref:hypothetical protein n=1 Tax=Halovivax limisalsi TaxID=1453760 RepID=UPI001FFD31D7|nr:hypothetical protein [Halovivax limisalsi]
MAENDDRDLVETPAETESDDSTPADSTADAQSSDESVHGESTAEASEPATGTLDGDERGTDSPSDQPPAGDSTTDEPTRSRSEAIRSYSVRAAGLIAGLGTLIFWSPILFTGFSYNMFLNILGGLALAIVGSLIVVRAGRDTVSAVFLPLVAAALAVGVIAIGIAVDIGTGLIVTSNVIVGSLVVVLALLTIVGFRKANAADLGSNGRTA